MIINKSGLRKSSRVQLILLDSGSAASGNSAANDANKVGLGVKDALEILAKVLPSIAILVIVLMFRGELSEFLKSSSNVDIFGFKIEKPKFDQALQDAAKQSGSARESWRVWGDSTFRKLKLAAPQLRGLRILWVDDHPENNFPLRRLLGDAGVQITVAMSNAEGIDTARRKDFDIVISDYARDPPLSENGGQLAKELERLGYGAIVLFYTSDPTRITADVPHKLATNDPTQLLSSIADLAILKD